MDWKSLPKGSPERAAAVREERRKLAAAARAKKAAKAVVEPVSADEVGDQKLSNREVIEWVWEHLGEARCPPAPNRKARELWRYAKKNRDGFLDKYVPLLMRAEKDEKEPETPEAEGKRAIGDALKHVLEVLDEMKERRPEASCNGEVATRL